MLKNFSFIIKNKIVKNGIVAFIENSVSSKALELENQPILRISSIIPHW